MRTLFVLPHLDDESISCGGLIQNRVKEFGSESVGVMVLFGRVYDYGRDTDDDEEEKDFFAAKRVLGYRHSWLASLQEGEPTQVGYYKQLEVVEGGLKAFHPTEVIIPASDDLNQDHRHLHHVCQIALRPYNIGSVRRVLEFIALDGRVRSPNYFVQLTAQELSTKIQAIGTYRREARTGSSPRSPQNVEAQARIWGACIGAEFAEAYRLYLERD